MDTPGFDLPGDPNAEITDLLLTVQKVLSPESYQIFTLLVVEGNTQQEARETLGISQPTLSREWIRIKRVLGHVFGEHVPARSRSRVCYSSGRSSSAVFRAT
jgi:DNA-directed RNA polymerase specialized sigma24 family protein